MFFLNSCTHKYNLRCHRDSPGEDKTGGKKCHRQEKVLCPSRASKTACFTVSSKTKGEQMFLGLVCWKSPLKTAKRLSQAPNTTEKEYMCALPWRRAIHGYIYYEVSLFGASDNSFAVSHWREFTTPSPRNETTCENLKNSNETTVLSEKKENQNYRGVRFWGLLGLLV